MTDLRQGVSPAVHAVLDLLDKGRTAWGSFSPEGLRAEIAIEAGALDGIEAGDDAAMASRSARRLAALLLFGIEQAAERQARIDAL
jgi:hypothetical protein